MKRILLFVFTLVCMNMATAQLVVKTNVENDLLYFEIEKGKEAEFKYEIKNIGSKDVTWYWEISKSANMPSDWEVSVCDDNKCYGASVTKDPKGNVIRGNSLVSYEVHIYANSKGAGNMLLKIYDNPNFTEPLYTSAYPVSTKDEVAIKNMNAYPNPTSGLFRIGSDDQVAHVEVFNIVGKKMASFHHVAGESHDIAYLRDGIYIVRLYDEGRNILKTVRLSKR